MAWVALSNWVSPATICNAGTRTRSLPGDLAVWDGHVAMVVGIGRDDRSQVSTGVTERRHGIASAHFMCPS